MEWEAVVFTFALNAPLTAIVVAVFLSPWLGRRKIRRALAKGTCQKRVQGVPGGICGMPIAARMDALEAYEYRFFQFLCYEHALDADRRARGRLYKIEWLEDEPVPPETPAHGAVA
jgi:hypothetical protein